MTIGQRIAQKRKEQGLSQEALGERLGVSRQAIYKWESDAALPEIDKLIALSRLFGVSVGMLLGVEETPAPAEAPSSEAGGELTADQLKMVEEIVSRYIAAQPKRRRRWPFVLAGVVLFFALFNLFERLDRVDQQYNYLQNSISSVQASVGQQIGGISDRVEAVLKAQNDLTADYGAELLSRNLENNTVLFSVYAVPKTYAEGMTAQFFDGASYVEGTQSGERFSAAVSSQLTDSIDLSVVFTYPDGTRQTQLLENYSGLYTDSLPEIGYVGENLIWMELTEPDTLVLREDSHERYIWLQTDVSAVAAVAVGPAGEVLEGPAGIRSIRVGLFRNQKLAAWAEPCGQPDIFHGFEDCDFYQLPALEMPLVPTDTVQIAAVVEDVFGRLSIQPSTPCCLDAENMRLAPPDNVIIPDNDIANWVLE